jgi:hypothetical protein
VGRQGRTSLEHQRSTTLQTEKGRWVVVGDSISAGNLIVARLRYQSLEIKGVLHIRWVSTFGGVVPECYFVISVCE